MVYADVGIPWGESLRERIDAVKKRYADDDVGIVVDEEFWEQVLPELEGWGASISVEAGGVVVARDAGGFSKTFMPITREQFDGVLHSALGLKSNVQLRALATAQALFLDAREAAVAAVAAEEEDDEGEGDAPAPSPPRAAHEFNTRHPWPTIDWTSEGLVFGRLAQQLFFNSIPLVRKDPGPPPQPQYQTLNWWVGAGLYCQDGSDETYERGAVLLATLRCLQRDQTAVETWLDAERRKNVLSDGRKYHVFSRASDLHKILGRVNAPVMLNKIVEYEVDRAVNFYAALLDPKVSEKIAGVDVAAYVAGIRNNNNLQLNATSAASPEMQAAWMSRKSNAEIQDLYKKESRAICRKISDVFKPRTTYDLKKAFAKWGTGSFPAATSFRPKWPTIATVDPSVPPFAAVLPFWRANSASPSPPSEFRVETVSLVDDATGANINNVYDEFIKTVLFWFFVDQSRELDDDRWELFYNSIVGDKNWAAPSPASSSASSSSHAGYTPSVANEFAWFVDRFWTWRDPHDAQPPPTSTSTSTSTSTVAHAVQRGSVWSAISTLLMVASATISFVDLSRRVDWRVGVLAIAQVHAALTPIGRNGGLFLPEVRGRTNHTGWMATRRGSPVDLPFTGSMKAVLDNKTTQWRSRVKVPSQSWLSSNPPEIALEFQTLELADSLRDVVYFNAARNGTTLSPARTPAVTDEVEREIRRSIANTIDGGAVLMKVAPGTWRATTITEILLFMRDVVQNRTSKAFARMIVRNGKAYVICTGSAQECAMHATISSASFGVAWLRTASDQALDVLRTGLWAESAATKMTAWNHVRAAFTDWDLSALGFGAATYDASKAEDALTATGTTLLEGAVRGTIDAMEATQSLSPRMFYGALSAFYVARHNVLGGRSVSHTLKMGAHVWLSTMGYSLLSTPFHDYVTPLRLLVEHDMLAQAVQSAEISARDVKTYSKTSFADAIHDMNLFYSAEARSYPKAHLDEHAAQAFKAEVLLFFTGFMTLAYSWSVAAAWEKHMRDDATGLHLENYWYRKVGRATRAQAALCRRWFGLCVVGSLNLMYYLQLQPVTTP